MTNKQKYRTFCEKEKNIPIFSKDWWLDSVCGVDNWDVVILEKGGNIFATMPYVLIKRLNLVTIGHPMLTQTMGIYFKYPKNQKYYKKLSFEKEMIEKILKELPSFDRFSQSFDYTHTNLLPFHWAGFEIKVNYTYVVENISIEELEKTLETDIRRRRRKAFEVGIEVYESEDIKKFYELNEMTFKRQGRDIPYSFEFIENLYSRCKQNNAVKMFFAKDKEGVVIAGNFLIYDENRVYYLMGGIDPNYKDLGGMDVVQFESIKFALASNRKFDFEGSMIESIEKYFRSFGAVQKPYFNISKTNSKLLKIRKAVKEILS
ncbi:MAG: GNAT family N-acetyltransferase [Campylobacterota bacterium]|nr:GNAT family N-acetyltransferase [Campylobacterota bacterium]